MSSEIPHSQPSELSFHEANYGNGDITIVRATVTVPAEGATLVWFPGMDNLTPKSISALATDVQLLSQVTGRDVLALDCTGERTNNNPLKKAVHVGESTVYVPRNQLGKADDAERAMEDLGIDNAHLVGYCLGAVPATVVAAADERVSYITYANPVGFDRKNTMRSAGRAVYGLGNDILTGRRSGEVDQVAMPEDSRTRSAWAHGKQYHADGWTVLRTQLHPALPALAQRSDVQMLSARGDRVYRTKRLRSVVKAMGLEDVIPVVPLEINSHVLGKGKERESNIDQVGKQIVLFEAQRRH